MSAYESVNRVMQFINLTCFLHQNSLIYHNKLNYIHLYACVYISIVLLASRYNSTRLVTIISFNINRNRLQHQLGASVINSQLDLYRYSL